jgi:hypothetical protein
MTKIPGTYDNPPQEVPPWEDETLTPEDLDRHIAQVLHAWKARGLEPHGLQLDMIPTLGAASVLIDYLIDKGVVDKDEINILYKREVLRQYATYLHDVLKHMAAQEEVARKLVAVPDKRIVGPHGEILGGN